jgi:hypothetical protein
VVFTIFPKGEKTMSVTTLDRDEMIDKLGKDGFHLDVLRTMPDEALAEILRVYRPDDDEDEDDDDLDGEYGELPEPANEHERRQMLSKARKYFDRARRAVRKYGDVGTHPKTPTHLGSVGGAEKEEIGQHFQKFSEEFSRLGVTRGQLVDGFRAARKIHYDMTLEQYLGVRP